MMQRTLDLSYDRLVIGSDLSAFAFCYEHSYPAIYARIQAPYEYNQNENYERQFALWKELGFALSNKHLPFSDKIVSLRLEEGNILKATTKQAIICNIKFNELFIFDDYNLEGLPPSAGKTNYDNWVIDYFDVKCGAKHDLDYIVDNESNFVKKIYFYLTQRLCFADPRRKDCVTVSIISDEQLASGEYDQNIARLKTISMMKANGIKGIWDKTNNRFVHPKLDSAERKIYPLGKNVYTGLPDNIKMIYGNC